MLKMKMYSPSKRRFKRVISMNAISESPDTNLPSEETMLLSMMMNIATGMDFPAMLSPQTTRRRTFSHTLKNKNAKIQDLSPKPGVDNLDLGPDRLIEFKA